MIDEVGPPVTVATSLRATIAGCRLQLCVDWPELAETVRAGLHGHCHDGDKAPAARLPSPTRVLRIRVGGPQDAPPPALWSVADPIVPTALPGADLPAYYTSRAVFRFASSGDLECILFRYTPSGFNAKAGRVVASDLHPERFYYRYLQFSLYELLWTAGRLPLHAACVTDPPRQRRLLLVGRSRTGKSTACAALLHDGWLMLSDDTVFVALDDGGCVYALRRPMHLDRVIGTRLPELRRIRALPPYLDGRNKVAVDPHVVYPGQVVDELPLPTVLVFPTIEPVERSAVRALSVDAARALLLDNAGAHDHGTHPPHQLSRAHVVERLLEAPAIALTCGRDALADPTRTAALLRTLR